MTNLLPSVTPPFDRFIDPARENSGLWRLLFGLGVLALTYFGFFALIFAGVYLVFGQNQMHLAFAYMQDLSTPFGVFLLMVTFFGLMLAPMASVKLVHKRSPKTLFGPAGSPIFRDFTFAVLGTALLSSVGGVIYFIYVGPIQNMPFPDWIFWLVPALPLLLVQVTAEELVFRGYLQQQFAARFSSRWYWWFLPSLIFGALHYDTETMGSNAWLAVVGTTIFGLIAADLTCRTGNIGAAVGLHFANNFFALLFLSLNGTITGLSLFVTKVGVDQIDAVRALMIWDICWLLILYALYLLFLRRMNLN